MYQRGCKLLFFGAVASLYSAVAFGTTYNLKENPNCSLAEAVEAVTWQQPVGACEAGTGSDRILLEQNKTYSLDAQLVVGGGTKTVKEKSEGEEGEESEEIDVTKPINNITLRIEVVAEPGQRNEEKELATVKAAAKDRVLWVRSGATVILEHVRLEGGDVTAKPLEVEWREHAASGDDADPTYSLNRFSEAPFGGVAFVEGTLTARTQVEMEGGSARKGGAVYANGNKVELAYTKLEGHRAIQGEIDIKHVVFHDDGCEEGCEPETAGVEEAWEEIHFALNTSYENEFQHTASGGAIHIQKGGLGLTQTWFENNAAEEGVGGAISTDAYSNANIVVDSAYFTKNDALREKASEPVLAGYGGALFFAENATNITHSAFRINVSIVNALLHDNFSTDKGAALHFSKLSDNSSVWLNNLTVFRNRTSGSGAGVWFEEPLKQANFFNSLVLANLAGSLKRAHRSDLDFESGDIVWECFEDPTMVEQNDAEQAITYCASYVEVDEDGEAIDQELKVWAEPKEQEERGEWFVFVKDEDGDEKLSLSDIGRLDKEWKVYDPSVKGLVEAEFGLLAEFIFESPDDISFEEVFPEAEWDYSYPPDKNAVVFEVRRDENSDPVLIFTKTPNPNEDEKESKYIYAAELNVDDEEGSKILLRHYYAAEEEDEQVTSKLKVNFVAWLNESVDFADDEGLFQPVSYKQFGYLRALPWSDKSVAIIASEETFNVTRLGWLKDEGKPVYVDDTGKFTAENREESHVANISHVSFVNVDLDGSIRPYLWFGQTESETELLEQSEQAQLLRGLNAKSCEEGCDPVEPEIGLPYFSINPDANSFTLLASGAPYIGSNEANVCESKDMRGLTRQDRCDAGAVDFQRALGEKDTFYITVGGKATFDVLKNDLGDSDVDCRRVDGFDIGVKATYHSCLNVIIQSTRAGVKTSVVVNEESGYPTIEYDSGDGFHGHDYFEYRASKAAFPLNTTLGANDVGARVAVVSEPSSGIQSKSLNQVGSAYFVWLLGLLGFGALRTGKVKRYVCALGIFFLSVAPVVNAAEVKVSDNEEYFTEISTQYPADVCTLRAAIASAEAPPTNTACSQGSGGISRDVILLPKGTFELIDTLKVNQNNPIEIRGEGPDKTIIKMREKNESGVSICARLFETESALTLSNLTLEGGCVESDSENRGGGALYAYGLTPPSVAMNNVHVKNNKAKGSANGGAVFLAYRADNRAEAVFDKVFFESNTAANGGAIYVDAIGDTSRNTIAITNSTFTNNQANSNSKGNVITLVSGNNVRINIVNSLFFQNQNLNNAAIDLSNHKGSTYVLNSTLISNDTAFVFAAKPARLSLHNTVISDEIEGSISGSNNLEVSYNLLEDSLKCPESGSGSKLCVRASDKGNNEFLAAPSIEELHNGELTMMEGCAEDNEDCLKQNRWFVPYLTVNETHDDAAEPLKLCKLISEEEDGTKVEEPVNCILERGNPAPLQTGVNAPANCRTTDMRGKSREAGGQCDRGAYETQINTAMPDVGNNTSRRSRTALLNVLRNDIPGDDMWIRTGTIVPRKLDNLNSEDENNDDTLALKKHFGDKNEKLSKFLELGKTKGELIVVKAEVPGADLSLGDDPVPQYYDDITITNADGREDPQSTDRAFNPKYQCLEDGDKDEECLIFYEAPKNYLCSDLPFEDYFAYSVEAWKYDSTKPLDKDELPEFEESEAAELFTGYVQVTIANIPPIVPYGGLTYRINPGDKVVVKLKDKGVKAIEGGVSDEIPIKLEKLTLDKEPKFALRSGRTHEVLGTGLFLNSEEMTVTYVHSDVSKTFADTFSVKVTDSCGASSIVPIRIEFHGAEQAGGNTPWAMTFLLVVAGAARRKLLLAKAA